MHTFIVFTRLTSAAHHIDIFNTHTSCGSFAFKEVFPVLTMLRPCDKNLGLGLACHILTQREPYFVLFLMSVKSQNLKHHLPSYLTLVLQFCTSPVQNNSPSKTGSTLVHCFYSFTAPFLSSNFGSFSCLLTLYICLTQHVTMLLAKNPKSIQFLKRNSQHTMLSMAPAKSLASYKLKLHAQQALFHTSTSEP